jgi:cytochrome c550
VPGSSTTLGTDGARIYAAKCAGCHGTSGEGNLGPALVGVADRLTVTDQIAVVANGRGTMLAFSPALTDEQIAAVVDYTRTRLP